MTLALALVIALVAAALVLEPLLRAASRRAGSAAAPSFEDADEDDPRLVRRDRALAALKEIEFDRATQKLSDDDYQKMKTQFTAEALEALREADAAAAPTLPPSHPPTEAAVEQLIASARAKGARQQRFCLECGAILNGKSSFCVECGAPAGSRV